MKNHITKLCLLSLLSLLSLSSFSFPVTQTLSGRVVKITDGDTFTLLTADNRRERIRLAGIDAPEKGQDFSEKSRRHLASLIAGKSVKVEYKTKDMYGRILGTVYAGSVNVNEEMIRSGLAWQYRYDRSKTFAALQRQAKTEKLNIWSLANPVSPYDYRKQKRNNRK
jgi:endonuclease YncB( thermonuclease family)